MRVLVTGGAGYIGSVVTAELIRRGHQVTVLDDLSTGHRDAVHPQARFVRGSIADADAVFALDAVDVVIHFAAKSLVAESVAAPQLYWANNVAGTLALLESMRAHDVRSIVFSSSAATYGDVGREPIAESAAAAPTNPYGASKLAVDQMLRSYADAYGFRAVSLRYFNVAGALIGEGERFGERHTHETHLIPIALQAAAGTRSALTVYGTDYPTPDGTCIRDYIHVLDLSDAHLQAAEWTLTAAETGSGVSSGQHLICNLGSGRGSSVREVVDSVRRVTGRSTPTVDAEHRSGDPAVLVASYERATAEFGWRPRRNLDEMVSDAWAFAQSQPTELAAGSAG